MGGGSTDSIGVSVVERRVNRFNRSVSGWAAGHQIQEECQWLGGGSTDSIGVSVVERRVNRFNRSVSGWAAGQQIQ